MALQGGDALARGAHKAQFAAGSSRVNDPIELKNVAAEEAATEAPAPVEIDRKRHAKRITPKGDQILVQRREAEDVSAGGILLAPDAKERPAEGVVISVGPDVEDIAEGDHIIFGKYAGTEYPWGGDTLLFMREDEVIATVEE